MERNTNLSKILSKIHENKWVALSRDRSKVLDYSESLLRLKSKIATEDAVYVKVLPSDMSFAF
jgi:hypothetical protein